MCFHLYEDYIRTGKNIFYMYSYAEKVSAYMSESQNGRL